MKRLFLYHCEACELDFGVAEEFDDHSIITCPSCQSDNSLKDYEIAVQYTSKSPEERKVEVNVYRMFEGEFGRPLSPIEIESLSYMEQEFPYDFIKLALREASISGKLRMKYVEAILRNWQKNNIKTLADAVKFSKGFRNRYQSSNQRTYQTTPVAAQRESVEKVPFYNWLES